MVNNGKEYKKQANHILIPAFFLLCSIGYTKSLAQSISIPHADTLKYEIGINLGGDGGTYLEMNTASELETDPEARDYLAAIHAYIIDNEPGSESVCKNLQSKKPKLFEQCMKVCILDCYRSLLLYTLLEQNTTTINNKPRQEMLSHWKNVLSLHKHFLPKSLINTEEVDTLLDLYFQKLFPYEKKNELGINHNISIFSDIPTMSHITFEQIQKAFDDEKARLKDSITEELECAFKETGINASYDRSALIDQKFQELKDEYYRLKIKDEAKRLVHEMMTISAYTYSCPGCIGLDDYELLEEKIHQLPHRQYFSDYLSFTISEIQARQDSGFSSRDYFDYNCANYLRDSYSYILIKNLEYNLKFGHELESASSILDDIKRLNSQLEYEAIHDRSLSFAYKIRQDKLRSNIYNIFRKLYSKQQEGYLILNTNPTQDEIMQLVIKELELRPDIENYKRFFGIYISQIGNSNRDEELHFFIESEFGNIVQQITKTGAFPELQAINTD